MKVAIIDDLYKNLKLYSEVLSTDFEVQTYSKPEDFLFKLTSVESDLILLDWHMPIFNGYEVLKKIRQQKPNIPVVMITAEYAESNLIEALEMGAEDFIVKPISNAELIARIKNKIEKSRAIQIGREQGRSKAISFDDLKSTVTIKNTTIKLQNKEYLVLRYIANNHHRFVSREELMSNIWNAPEVNSTTLDTHMSVLRKKLGIFGELVITKRGQGYLFNAKEIEGIEDTKKTEEVMSNDNLTT